MKSLQFVLLLSLLPLLAGCERQPTDYPGAREVAVKTTFSLRYAEADAVLPQQQDALRLAAAKGDARAANNLGWMLEQEGHAAAADWYRRAAHDKDICASYNLGLLYMQGRTLPRDYSRALKWLGRAAEGGLAEAQFQLGNLHLGGHGTPQDMDAALKWYRAAAGAGLLQAAYQLGLVYRYAPGKLRSWEEAARWFRSAAEAGDLAAQVSLGRIYMEAASPLRDPRQAALWWHMAAEQGHARIQTSLSQMYAAGEGLPRDLRQAWIWASLAAGSGNRRAPRLAKRFGRQLAAAELADAKKELELLRRQTGRQLLHLGEEGQRQKIYCRDQG